MGDSYTNNRIVQIDFDGSTVGTLSGTCKELILSSTQACYIAFNTATVSAVTGFMLPANSPVEIDLANVSTITAIKVSSSGKLTILELF
jgi:hypothetical protein